MHTIRKYLASAAPLAAALAILLDGTPARAQAITHQQWEGNWFPGFSGWDAVTPGGVGANANQAPTLVSRSPGTFDMLVMGMNHHYFITSFLPGFTEWLDVPGNMAFDSEPGVSSWDSQRLDLFGVKNGKLWHTYHASNGFPAQWEDHGTPAPGVTVLSSARPAVFSQGVGNVGAIVCGSDLNTYVLEWNSGWSWHSFPLDSGFCSAPIVVVAGSRLDAFDSGGGFFTHHYRISGSGWDSDPTFVHRDMSFRPAGPIAAVRRKSVDGIIWIDALYPEAFAPAMKHLVFEVEYPQQGPGLVFHENIPTTGNQPLALGVISRDNDLVDTFRVNPVSGHVEQNAGVALVNNNQVAFFWSGWIDHGLPGPLGQAGKSPVAVIAPSPERVDFFVKF